MASSSATRTSLCLVPILRSPLNRKLLYGQRDLCSRHLQHDRVAEQKGLHIMACRSDMSLRPSLPQSHSSLSPPQSLQSQQKTCQHQSYKTSKMHCSCPGGTAQHSIPVLPQRACQHLGQGLLRPISRPKRKQNVTFAAKKVSRHSKSVRQSCPLS